MEWGEGRKKGGVGSGGGGGGVEEGGGGNRGGGGGICPCNNIRVIYAKLNSAMCM